MRSDTTPSGRRDLAAIWSATHDRILDLLADQPPSCADRPVPTLDGATVRDVLLHLADSAACAAGGGDVATTVLRLSSPQPDLTSTLKQLFAGWNSAVSGAGELTSDGRLLALLITDAVMSEHDLRTALGTPGARDDVAVKVALDELAGRFSDRVAAARLPSLRVTVEQWGTIIGDGRASCCVVADRFEFVRAMSGRRSAPEISRWNWSDDPAPYLGVISEHDLPANEIRERDPRVPEHMRDREFVL